MRNQALFSSNGNSTELKCRLLQFLFGALRVNIVEVDAFVGLFCGCGCFVWVDILFVILTFTVPIMTAADAFHKYFSLFLKRK